MTAFDLEMTRLPFCFVILKGEGTGRGVSPGPPCEGTPEKKKLTRKELKAQEDNEIWKLPLNDSHLDEPNSPLPWIRKS